MQPLDPGSDSPVFLSNREKTGSLSELPEIGSPAIADVMSSGFGIDRLSLGFDVDDFNADPSVWSGERMTRVDGEEASRTLTTLVDVGAGISAFVSLHRSSPGSPTFGKVEFNPSRVIDPDGFSLASVESPLSATWYVLTSMADIVRPVGDLDLSYYRVKRLDVARDFTGVTNPSALIRGLAPVPRSWARKNLVHADPSKHGAQTLMVGSGAGVVRLYDKFEESAGLVAPGTVRWEAECRSGWVQKYGGIGNGGDICEETVYELAANRWEWSKMGVKVTSQQGVVDTVSRSDMTPRMQASFIGWLVQQGSDNAWQPGKATLAEYRKRIEEFGVVLGPNVLQSVDYSSELDFWSGLEMLALPV